MSTGVLTVADAQRLNDLASAALNVWRHRRAWSAAARDGLAASGRPRHCPVPAAAPEHAPETMIAHAREWYEQALTMMLDADCLPSPSDGRDAAVAACRRLVAACGRPTAISVAASVHEALIPDPMHVRRALAAVPTFEIAGRVYVL